MHDLRKYCYLLFFFCFYYFFLFCFYYYIVLVFSFSFFFSFIISLDLIFFGFLLFYFFFLFFLISHIWVLASGGGNWPQSSVTIQLLVLAFIFFLLSGWGGVAMESLCQAAVGRNGTIAGRRSENAFRGIGKRKKRKPNEPTALGLRQRGTCHSSRLQ